MRKITFTLFTLLTVSFAFGQRASSLSPSFHPTVVDLTNLERVTTTVCDTVTNLTAGDTTALYTVAAANGGGYVSGHNGYGDIAKAEFFSYTGTPATIPAISILFGVGKAANATDSLHVKVWADNAGTVGTQLYSQAITYQTIKIDVDSGRNTIVVFNSPVAVTGSFYVGIEFGYAAGDTVAILTNRDGNTPAPGTAWEKWSDNAWHSYSETPASWGLNMSHRIVRVLCTEAVNIQDGVLGGQFSLYPNPNSGTFSLDVRNAETKSAVMTVSNLQGQVVYTENLSFLGGSISKEVNLGNLANGLYIVNITADGKTSNHKLMIQQ